MNSGKLKVMCGCTRMDRRQRYMALKCV